MILPLVAACFVIPPIFAVKNAIESKCFAQFPSLSLSEFPRDLPSISSLPSLADLEVLLESYDRDGDKNGETNLNWEQCAKFLSGNNGLSTPAEQKDSAQMLEQQIQNFGAGNSVPEPTQNVANQPNHSNQDPNVNESLKEPTPEEEAQFKSTTPGVSYNRGRWTARVNINGREIIKSFSSSKYGFEKAMRMAQNFRLSHEKYEQEKYGKLGFAESRFPGVHLNGGSWVARRHIESRRYQQGFSIAEYGNEKAKEMAIAYRKLMDDDDFAKALPEYNTNDDTLSRKRKRTQDLTIEAQLEKIREEIAAKFQKEFNISIPPVDFKSNVPGVRYMNACWESVVRTGDKVSKASFPVVKHGFYAAKKLAENHQLRMSV